ncbi:MAG: sialate O-acetylesterase [Mycobacteriales bacterium]
MTLTHPTRTQVSHAAINHHQVIQRDGAEGAAVPLPTVLRRPGTRVVALSPRGLQLSDSGPEDETLWLPTGGPYDIALDSEAGREVLASDVFVGDLWLLGGQSNMEGCARLRGRELPRPEVRVLDMTGRWRAAEDPLHMKWLSPYPVHDQLSKERDERHAERLLTEGPDAVAYMEDQLGPDELVVEEMRLGVGPGVAFGNELVRRTGVPVGLIPAAHGGSSMAEWSTELPRDGSSLFGAALQSVALAGGRIRGLLWYQGESESDPGTPWTYDDELATLFDRLRTSLGYPDLFIACVQLGRYALPGRHTDFDLRWSRLREAQRLCASASAVVTAVDLELDDPIHLATAGQLRLGRRLARVAAGDAAITLRRVEVTRDGLGVDVTFDGVTGGLSAHGGRLVGFSIRKPDGTDCAMVFHEEVIDGATVRLQLSRRVIEGDQLWYGFGADPVCNIVDAEDMAVPAFGPVTLTSAG